MMREIYYVSSRVWIRLRYLERAFVFYLQAQTRVILMRENSTANSSKCA